MGTSLLHCANEYSRNIIRTETSVFFARNSPLISKEAIKTEREIEGEVPFEEWENCSQLYVF
jgi:hypothetical protein